MTSLVIDVLLFVLGGAVGWIVRPYFTRKAENAADKQDTGKLTMLKLVAEEQDSVLRDLKKILAEIELHVIQLSPIGAYDEQPERNQKKELFKGLSSKKDKYMELALTHKALFPEFFRQGTKKITRILLDLTGDFIGCEGLDPSSLQYKEHRSSYFIKSEELWEVIDEFRTEIDKYRQST